MLTLAGASLLAVPGGLQSDGWLTAAFLVLAAATPLVVLGAAAGYRRGAERWPGVVVWFQAVVLACAGYGLVLLAGRERGWDDTLTLALGAGVFVFTVGSAGRLLERHALTLTVGPARPTDVLAGLGPVVAGGLRAHEGLARLAQEVRESTGVDAVVIIPARAGAPRVVSGSPDGPSVRIELRTRRETIGDLVLHARPAVLRRTIGPLKAPLGGLIGAAVLLADLNADLEALRSRTLSTRREEQRLLHRELSSRLTPAIDEVVTHLERAQTLAGSEPDAARVLVAQARDRLAGSAGDVRALARALLPASLDRGDLAEALAQLTATSGGGVRWQVRVEQAEGLSPRTLLAFYLVAVDVVGAAESAGTGVGLGLTVVTDAERPRMRVSTSSAGDSRPLRRDLRAALEQRAVVLALSIDERSDGFDIEVPAW